MSQEILEKVRSIVAEQLSVDAAEVKPESNFQNDLGADSLDTVELVMALEEAFDIEIPDEAAEGSPPWVTPCPTSRRRRADHRYLLVTTPWLSHPAGW